MASPEHVPKKRRFFKDDVDDATDLPVTPISEIATPLTSGPSSPTRQEDVAVQVDTASTFSQQLLAILDEDLSPHVIRSLEDAAGGNIERAVNMYFDGSWETHVRDVNSPRQLVTTQQKRDIAP